MEISFRVSGSAPDPYEVTFLRTKGQVAAFCTCPAGESGQYCKHRLAIMEGNAAAIVSQNHGDVETVRTWLVGTELETALSDFRQAESVYDSAKVALGIAKKDLAMKMRG
jgi:uncharacterized Zn finger protein